MTNQKKPLSAQLNLRPFKAAHKGYTSANASRAAAMVSSMSS
jgi:hypothetical protein